MINKMLENYKEIYSIKNIWKYFHWKEKAKLILIVLLNIGTVTLTSFNMNNKIGYVVASNVFLILSMLAFRRVYNNQLSKTITETFGKKDMREYNEFRRQQFINKLDLNEVSISKLEYLVKYVKEYAKELKTPYLIKNGFIGAIFIPIWSAYITTFFNFSLSIKELILVTIINTFLALVLLIMYVNVQMLIEDFTYADYNRLVSIQRILEEVYIQKLGKISKGLDVEDSETVQV